MLENLYTPNCIRTVSGRYVNVFALEPHMIHIGDIAHALSNTPRFGGHLPRWYSVAMHSLHVADLVEPEHKLSALLHDASEAYLLDMPKPIKDRLPDYMALEQQVQGFIAKVYQLPHPLPSAVKAADEQALRTEWRTMMLGQPQPSMRYLNMKPDEVRVAFVESYHDLVEERKDRLARTTP